MEREKVKEVSSGLYSIRPPHQMKFWMSLPLGYLGVSLSTFLSYESGYGFAAALPATPVGFMVGYTAGCLVYNKLTNDFEERQSTMYDALSSIEDSRRRLEDIARSMRPPEDAVDEDRIIDEDDR